MKKIPKQEYTAEFRELAVKRVKDGLAPGAAAKELGVNRGKVNLNQPRLTGAHVIDPNGTIDQNHAGSD